MRSILLMCPRIALRIRAIYPKMVDRAIRSRSSERHPIFMGLRRPSESLTLSRKRGVSGRRPVMDQQPKWKYVASIYLKRKHVLIFRDNGLGLQLQVISRISNPGSPSRKLYFVDGDNRAHATEAELLQALASGPDNDSGRLHPLYVQCVPGTVRSEAPDSDPAPRFPTLLQQGLRWFVALTRRIAAQALQAGYRFPLHRPTR
jgi:hypothetical protein